MIRFRIALGLTLAAGLAAQAWAAPLPGQLSAADVRTRIVGHSVVSADKAKTWSYLPTGAFEANGGARGRFTVRDDGQLCWKETDGAAGCFAYIQNDKQLSMRRVDAGNEADLGPVTLGK